MIISRTPLRISFVGGGSDLAAFYEQEPGAVVSTAIDKYIYINVNTKFDQRLRASYSVTEMVDHVDELQHELIREALKLVKVEKGIEITSISDIPSRGTGMGSSSTYTVGLLNALHAYTGRHAGAERLARESCWIEIEKCGKPIGKQDQYIAAYGGFQYIQFNPDGSVFVDPIICRPETRALLRTMVRMAQNMREALCANDLECFGEMLHEAWMMKRQLTDNITNSSIDDWYARARKAGAVGGKLLGAGGGGFLLLYADPDVHPRLVEALPELRPVPFCFEPQGSKVIYVEE